MHDVLDLDLSYRPTVRLYVRAVVRSIHVATCGRAVRCERASGARRARTAPAASQQQPPPPSGVFV
eukprot:COSAG01_NODE_55499_length_324_cov_1.573333_1_plen_65_part_10